MSNDVPTRFTGLASVLSMMRVVVPVATLVAVLAILIGHPDKSLWLRIEAVSSAVIVVILCEVAIGTASALIKLESNTYRVHDLMMDVRDSAVKQTKLLETIARQTQLSDMARGIAYREEERDLIRRAFNESLIGGDFEAAAFLADQLEERHGHRSEADRLRGEIEAARLDNARRRAKESLERIEALLNRHDWDAARFEMENLMRAYPADQNVQKLPELLRQRRMDHKRRLLKEWDESVQRNEIDRGIELLKQLDQYLTPNEAAALEESARGVFRAKLHNMGVQFSLAVHDRQWTEALEIGQQIIAEFPNSRMSAEVREHLDALKQRAARGPVESGAEA